jgi:hypothetical protein
MTLQPVGFPSARTPHCGHVAYANRSYDATKGEFDEKILVTAAAARADDGLCGPEALLFHGPPIWKRMATNAYLAAYGLFILGTFALLKAFH